MRASFAVGITILALGILLAADGERTSLKDSQAVAGWELVRSKLREFYEERGEYPLRLSELVNEGFLEEFPKNPYVGGWRMEQVRSASWAEGKLVYHPFSLGGEKIDSYFLGVYGGSIEKIEGDPNRLRMTPSYFSILYGFDNPLAKALLKYSFSLTETELKDLKKKENRKKIQNLPQTLIDELDAQMKSNAHLFRLMVERFAVDNYGTYPPSIERLQALGYFADYPDNPYYLLDDSAPAKVIPAKLEDGFVAGSVVYHPFVPDGTALETYLLLARGTRQSKSKDLFYGPVAWDNLYYILPEDLEKDGFSEGFLIAFSSVPAENEPSIEKALRDNPGVILQDASWPDAQPDNRAKDALHRIQLSIERYAADDPNGVYPPDLQTLVDEGYLYWPLNPYAEDKEGVKKRMTQVKPGDFEPGGVIYLPFEFPSYEGKGYLAYYLAVYGAEPDGGMDVGSFKDGSFEFYWDVENVPAPPNFAGGRDGENDGIIIVLSSGPAEMFAGD